MNKYDYILTTCTGSKIAEIHEFVTADNIIDAYTKTMVIVNDLNKVNTDYVWTLKCLENGYFCGIDSNNM